MVPPRVGACLGGSPAGGLWPGGLDRGLPSRLTKVPGTADRPVKCAGAQHWRRPGNSIVGCIGDDSEAECRALMECFVGRCVTDRLQLSIGKTKELLVDYRRSGGEGVPQLLTGWEVGQERTRRKLDCFYFFYVYV